MPTQLSLLSFVSMAIHSAFKTLSVKSLMLVILIVNFAQKLIDLRILHSWCLLVCLVTFLCSCYSPPHCFPSNNMQPFSFAWRILPGSLSHPGLPSRSHSNYMWNLVQERVWRLALKAWGIILVQAPIVFSHSILHCWTSCLNIVSVGSIVSFY